MIIIILPYYDHSIININQIIRKVNGMSVCTLRARLAYNIHWLNAPTHSLQHNAPGSTQKVRTVKVRTHYRSGGGGKLLHVFRTTRAHRRIKICGESRGKFNIYCRMTNFTAAPQWPYLIYDIRIFTTVFFYSI